MKTPRITILITGLLALTSLAGAQITPAPAKTSIVGDAAGKSVIGKTETSFTTELKRNDVPIRNVVVFPGWARVTREGKVDLPKGQCRWVLTGLPGWVDLDSLQAQVESKTGARLTEAFCTSVETPFITEEAIRTEKKQIAGIGLQITEAEARLNPLEDEIEYLKKLMPWSLDKTGEESKVRPVTAAEIREVSEYFIKAREDIVSKQAKINREIITLKEQQKERSERLEKAIRHAPVRNIEICLGLQAEAAETVSIQLSYITAGASWYPSHALILNETSNQAQLRPQATIQQATGETWGKCTVSVSSAPLSVDEDSVPSQTWNVPPDKPKENDFWACFGPGMSSSARTRLAGLDKLWQEFPEDDRDKKQTISKVLQNRDQMADCLTEMVARGIIGNLTVETPCTVPTDGSVITIAGAPLSLDTTTRYTAKPAFLPEPVATLCLENTRETPILPGWVTCIRNGRMLGKTRVHGAQTGEMMTVPIGSTATLTVERRLDTDGSGLDILGAKRSLTLRYCVTLTNREDRATDVMLLENLPVITPPEKIGITLLNATPRAETTSTEGLKWGLTVPAKGVAQVVYSYRIDYIGDDLPLALRTLVNQVKNSTQTIE